MIDREVFRLARQGKKLSQKALGEAVGKSQQLITQIENGVVTSTKAIYRLARVLDMPAHVLDPEIPAGGTEDDDDEPQIAREVPILSWVSAGKLTKVFDQDDIMGTIKVGDLDPRGDWMALKVEGDSMDRISPPGSVILVNRKDKRLAPNACYVIADGDSEVTYKRWRPNPRRFEPVSTNPAHEPIFYEQEPTIIGRVKKTILDM